MGPRSPPSYCSGTPASGASPLPWAAERLLRPCVSFPQGKGSGRRAVGPQPRGGLPAGPTQATPRRSRRSGPREGGREGPLGSGVPRVLLGAGLRVGALTSGRPACGPSTGTPAEVGWLWLDGGPWGCGGHDWYTETRMAERGAGALNPQSGVLGTFPNETLKKKKCSGQEEQRAELCKATAEG